MFQRPHRAVKLIAMPLAALTFSDPLMLAGLLAALVPVMLHLLNRVRAPIVPFPTLRFLKITAQKTARRRHIQQYFLLLVRVIVFLMIALAVAAPLIHGGAASLAYGLVGLMLGAMALLVLGGVWSAAAVDRAKSQKTAGSSDAAVKSGGAATPGTVAAKSPRRPGTYWALSLFALALAVILAGFSAYGLVSDRFFSGDRGEFHGQSTALVIIFDNSYSMLAREDGRTRLDRAKEQARQVLGTLQPAVCALLPTNPGDLPMSNTLRADTSDLLGSLEKLQPFGRAQPMRERIKTALQLLASSDQAGKMLVIVSDFARPAFADAEVFSAVKSAAFRKDLQVVLLPVGKRQEDFGNEAAGENKMESPADVGIAKFALAENSERPAAGAQLVFEASLVNNSNVPVNEDFVFTLDGEPVKEMVSHVALGAAGTPEAHPTLRIPYRLALRGAHEFGLRLDHAQDAMAWDDQRALVLDVADQIKVLVIGAEDGALPPSIARPRARSAAFYLEAALSPYSGDTTTRPGGGGGGGAGASIPWSIQPTYRGINQVGDAAMAGYSAIFMCDVPVVPAAVADALTRFTRANGRLIWVLGPAVHGAAYNQILLSNNRALLPAALGAPLVTQAAWPLDWVDMHESLFANLYDSEEPFRSVLVTGHWTFADALPSGVKSFAKLANGDPLVTAHSVTGSGAAGGGKIYTMLTTPAAAWSNLGGTDLLVPMASRMALGDSSESHAATSYETGQPAEIIPDSTAGAIAAATSIDVTTPDHVLINARNREPGAAARWSFDRTSMPGLYRWKSTDGRASGMFVVNPPGDEAELISADIDALARESSPGPLDPGKATVMAWSPAELLAQLEHRSEGTSLVPGFLAMVLILAIIEALLSNRHQQASS